MIKKSPGYVSLLTMLLYLFSYRRKEANRDKADITKMEVHPSNQRILWKSTDLFCKQLKSDIKYIQYGILPNLKVTAGKKLILSFKCVGSIFPTPIGTCAWEKTQDISLIPDVLGRFPSFTKTLSNLNALPLFVIKLRRS